MPSKRTGKHQSHREPFYLACFLNLASMCCSLFCAMVQKNSQQTLTEIEVPNLKKNTVMNLVYFMVSGFDCQFPGVSGDDENCRERAPTRQT